MRYKTFKLPLYSPRLLVVVGKVTADQMNNLVFRKFGVDPEIPDDLPKWRGFYWMEGKNVVIWIKSMHAKGAVGVVAHECLHATRGILKYSGLRLTDSSEEAYTYLLDWMVSAIWKWGRG